MTLIGACRLPEWMNLSAAVLTHSVGTNAVGAVVVVVAVVGVAYRCDCCCCRRRRRRRREFDCVGVLRGGPGLA